MIHYEDSVSPMLETFSKLQAKLQKLIVRIGSSKDTTITYWSSLQRDVKDVYEEMRLTFIDWTKNIPKEYYKSVSDMIKELKLSGYKTNINITDIQNMHASSQNVDVLLNDSIVNFVQSLENGNKQINRIIQSTQQLNISEKQVNQDIAEGLQINNSLFYAKRKLKDDLLDKVADGKIIKVINKNGDEMNFDINDYAEMVARTKIREAQTAGVLQTAMALEEDLVQVSPNPGCEEICQDYVGKVYSLSGNDPDFPQLDDDPPFHPNCRHSLTIYIRDFQSDEKIVKDIEFANAE